jgi:hypothetical protein
VVDDAVLLARLLYTEEPTEVLGGTEAFKATGAKYVRRLIVSLGELRNSDYFHAYATVREVSGVRRMIERLEAYGDDVLTHQMRVLNHACDCSIFFGKVAVRSVDPEIDTICHGFGFRTKSCMARLDQNLVAQGLELRFRIKDVCYPNAPETADEMRRKMQGTGATERSNDSN